MLRHFSNGLVGAVCVVLFLVLLRVTWSPDPAQSLFLRAGQLENAGQVPRALRAYAVISDRHPDSFYAPRALLRQGDLLAGIGTRDGDRVVLRDAVTAYQRLATAYPRDGLVDEALLDAARISLENLGDLPLAGGFYAQLLEQSSAKSDTAALATLRLGEIALQSKDKTLAKTLLQRVLVGWPGSERGAEAQFTLGVAYETLYRNKEWATNAYNATIARYPNSAWATQARQKLGLLVYSVTLGKRPARRVLIQIDALPDDGVSDGSLWSALRLILAAHGVEISEATLGGWSLAPFYAGFDPKNPGRVVKPQIDGFENVLANAGLRFSVQSGGKKAAEALRGLQDEIDAARAPLVYFEENGAKTWALCVGYDSERGEVMLQSRGARFDTLSAPVFARYWEAKSRFGQGWTMISLVPNDQKRRPLPSLTPTPSPSASPDATSDSIAVATPFATPVATGAAVQLSAPDLQNAPAFVWELPKVSLRGGDSRARFRAALILARGRSGNVLLGAAGLDRLAGELKRIAKARPATVADMEIAPLPSSTLSPTPLGNEGATEGSTDVATEGESPYAPDATPTPLPQAPSTPAPRLTLRRKPPRDDSARATALLRFLDAPARSWASNRREAAAWCDEASKRSKDTRWQVARDALRRSADALESAMELAPSSLSSPLGAGDRAQIGETARQIEVARDAELAAARALGGQGG